MLKLKYLFENYELAKKCLSKYEFDQDTIDEMLAHFRISSNAIYPFKSKSGMVCFLRLSPIEEKSEKDVKSEIQLIEWLIKQGFPAMKPHAMKDGRLSTTIDTKWGRVNLSCFEVVLGKILEECDASPKLVRGYGKTLGWLHQCLKTYPYADSRKNHKALMLDIKDKFIMYHAPSKLMEEWEKLNTILQLLPINTENYGIVHYDFQPDNVLFSVQSNSYGVIDFDDAIRCWFSLDIVRAIDCLDSISENENLAKMKEEFISGYRESCLLSEEQLNMMPTMRRLVDLQEYSTILHVLSEPVENKPQWMIKIISKLQYKLQLIEDNIALNTLVV